MKDKISSGKLVSKLSKYQTSIQENLWNHEVKRENYVEDDYLKRIANDRDTLLNLSLSMNERRWKVTTSNTVINTTVFSLFTFAIKDPSLFHGASLYLLVSFLFVCILYCLGWCAKIYDLINDNISIAATIYEYEKLLPTRPLYSMVLTSNAHSNFLQRKLRFYEKYVPIFFSIIYLILFFVLVAN